ncbi:hypothetical protein PIB30_018207 [Stylosanthes scabra]|uniref:Ubiquitin-like protease family profile domain-containing protein n=1 Tax=Stylosanthes scabra TaxID=79078 RepID=A0ABU6U809_9FABA|nr:hypothetical protein [Stylosanthes scabra]
MFEKCEHKWLDNKKKPQDFKTLLNHKEFLSYLDKDRLQSHRFLSAPTLFARHWWLYVLDVEKKHLFVLDSKNVVSPSSERTQMGRFGAELEKFREKIVSNILLSPENTMRLDVITEVNEIRLSRPSAPLRSPFTQLDLVDLKTK